jgi:hypothetical protein
MKHLANLICACVVTIGASAQAQPIGDAPPPPPPPPPAAGPGVCVNIDPGRDTLADTDRGAARNLLLQAFESERLRTDPTNTSCTELYTVSNIKLGNTINITITGNRGTRTGRATSLDDLPNVYSQMVKSLVTGVPMETGGGATDRANVTKDQSAPRRVAADNLKYLQLGYGGITGGATAFGPAFAFGWRKELDRIALDISIAFLMANDSDLSDGITLAIPKLAILWNQSPTADATLYYGPAVSYGASFVAGDAGDYGGSGMQLGLMGGYEAFRSSTIRGFVQLDVTLPLYRSEYSFSGSDARRWTPSAFVSLGIGWGKSNVVRVINE